MESPLQGWLYYSFIFPNVNAGSKFPFGGISILLLKKSGSALSFCETDGFAIADFRT
jgi:hypothetical protein